MLYSQCTFALKVGTSDIWFQSMTSIEDEAHKDSAGSSSDGLEAASEAVHLPEDLISTQSEVLSDENAQKRHIEKSFFFSVEDVQYNRDVSPMVPFPNTSNTERSSPAHILTVTGAKGAWTQSNRDMAFSLYDSW